MLNLHIKATPCAKGFRPIIELCKDGNRIMKHEPREAFKSEQLALEYAELLGAQFIRTKELATIAAS